MEMIHGLVYPKKSPAACSGQGHSFPESGFSACIDRSSRSCRIPDARRHEVHGREPGTECTHHGYERVSPGDDVNLVIAVDNTGLNQYKIVQSGIIDRTDQSNTAKQLTATLSAGDAPIVVKADPQVLGDLAASSTASGTYHIKVSQDAASGTYDLPLVLNYTYMYQVEQTGTETLQYMYKSVNQTVTLPIRIKPVVQIEVTNISAQDLNAANEGYVTFTVKNTGYENGTNAAVRIAQRRCEPDNALRGQHVCRGFPDGCNGRLPVPG